MRGVEKQNRSQLSELRKNRVALSDGKRGAAAREIFGKKTGCREAVGGGVHRIFLETSCHFLSVGKIEEKKENAGRAANYLGRKGANSKRGGALAFGGSKNCPGKSLGDFGKQTKVGREFPGEFASLVTKKRIFGGKNARH